MTLYKLTDQNMQTYGETQWSLNVPVSAEGDAITLCSNGFIHAYENPWIALIMNPQHANFLSPRLFIAEGTISIKDGVLKCGCKSLTLVSELSVPTIETEKLVEFAIKCALSACKDTRFNRWAKYWLNNSNRSAADAATAAGAADADINLLQIVEEVFRQWPD